MLIGDQRILFKMKVTLILCVFSGSDVGGKWWLLYSLLHPTTKHLKRLIRDILVDTMVDWWQFTQGGSMVRRPGQSTLVGGVCAELHHSDRALRTAWFEKGDFKIEIKKKNWLDFFTIGWMCTNTSNTHVQTTWKVNFASDDSFTILYFFYFFILQFERIIMENYIHYICFPNLEMWKWSLAEMTLKYRHQKYICDEI